MADSERIGPYRVIRKLGAGGMGEVVLAHDDRLDRLVAIKRLHDNHAATPDRRERFRREARIVARLNHPAIVKIHDVLHQGDHDYLIMEYIEGQTLRARCDSGPMSVSEVLGIVHQIALGMAAAHDLGVIHRDLKVENILITPADRAKITDFGIAKLHGDDTLTADGVVVGTFRAMSPEQALGRAIDHRSDLFSFGILLYEALARVSPFRADTPFLTVQRLVLDDPQPITELVPSIPGGLASLIHQLLAKEPLLRPRDFHEVADALIELAGQACDAPCHAGSSPGGGPQSPGEDTESTGGSPVPVRPRPTSAPAAAGGSSAPTIPSSGIISGLNETVDAAVESLARAADSNRPAPLDTSDHATVPARRRGAPRRLAWYVAAVGLTVLGALGIGYAVRGRHSGATLIRVAVLPPDFSDAADRTNVALLASRVRDAVMADVRARGGIDLVAWGDIDSYVEGLRQHPGSPPGQRTIRAVVGADEVIATHIECLVPSSCRVRIERDANSASSPPPESFDLATDSVGSLGATVTLHLSRLYPDHPGRDAAAAGSIDPRDYERYSRLVHNYWAGRAALSPNLLVELEGIRERSPSSLDVLLFEAEVLRHDYLQTNDSDQAGRAMALLQAADKLFPNTYSILSARFDILLAAHHEGNAGMVLDQLAILDPDSSVTHLQRAKLHFQRDELERARGELDEAAQRDSLSWRVLYYRARVSRKLDDQAATGVAIDQLLERSPGNYAGVSLRAREELAAGRMGCAEQLYAQLVAREPLYDECVGLGYARNQLGRYREAADSFRRVIAFRPNDPSARLNLVESLLLDGNTSGSGEQLRELTGIFARKRRDSPTGALAGNDLEMEAQTLAYLGLDDPDLATQARARTAELLTPTARSSALYTAALVYAVLGDRAQAATYVTRYLDRGGSAAQFSYRWFDDLRWDPVLGPKLVVPTFAPSCEPASAP